MPLSIEQVSFLQSKGYIWPEHAAKHRTLQIGTVYNSLTPIAIVRQKPCTEAKVLCSCSCGKLTLPRTSSVLNGLTKSCGCACKTNGGTIKHGLSHLGIWKSWHNMVDRCTNETHPKYERYSKLGCILAWSDFETFYAETGSTWFNGAHLDRIDNNKGYYLANVQWLSHSDHATKTREDLKELIA